MSVMQKERIVLHGGIEIAVNEKGDTIVLNPDDEQFIEKFFDLIDKMQKMQDEQSTDNDTKLSDREKLHKRIEVSKKLVKDIDELFGQDSCKKIFGEGVVPSAFLVSDFFEQLIPIAERYAGEREKKIAERYNNNRKGANSGNRNTRRNKHNNRNNKYRNKEEIIRDTAR